MSLTDQTTAAPAPAPNLAQKIIVGLENDVAYVEHEIALGWAWVENEFTHLKSEANTIWQWVQKEDPQLQSYMHALLVGWEADAAKVAAAASGAAGNLIANEGAVIETGVANFAQGILGKLGVSGSSSAASGVALLASQGEGLLLSMVKSALAKVLAVVVAPANP